MTVRQKKAKKAQDRAADQAASGGDASAIDTPVDTDMDDARFGDVNLYSDTDAQTPATARRTSGIGLEIYSEGHVVVVDRGQQQQQPQPQQEQQQQQQGGEEFERRPYLPPHMQHPRPNFPERRPE